jgi:hypothetical protein
MPLDAANVQFYASDVVLYDTNAFLDVLETTFDNLQSIRNVFAVLPDNANFRAGCGHAHLKFGKVRAHAGELFSRFFPISARFRQLGKDALALLCKEAEIDILEYLFIGHR